MAIALLVSKRVTVRRIEEAFARERGALLARAAREHTSLLQAGAQALRVQGHELLRLSALPLSWAVRTELLQKDLSEVGVYFRQIVREPRVRRAALVGSDGVVQVASNQKLEGKSAAEVFPGVPMSAPEPQMLEPSPDEVVMTVPVMGLTERLGTLVVGYEPRTFQPPPPP